MPSNEFQHICRDLQNIGESVKLTIVKGGVDFSAYGDIGHAKIHLTERANFDDEKDAVTVDISEPVNLTFALRLESTVILSLILFDSGTSISSRKRPRSPAK